MVCTDPSRGRGNMRRPVSAMSWCSDGGSKLAIGYCSPEFLGTPDNSPSQGKLISGKYIRCYSSSIIFIVIRLHIQCWGSHKALWCPDDNKSYNKPFLQHQRSTAAGRRLLQWPDLLVGCESRLQTCGSSGVWALPLRASLQHNLDSKQVWHRAHDWRLWWLCQVKFQQLWWKTNMFTLDGGTSEILKKRRISLLWTQKIRILNMQVKIYIYRLKPNAPTNEPIYLLNIYYLGNQEKALTVSCLEYEPTIPAKFMIGTDQGVALMCSRKAKCQSECIVNSYEAHYGPIRALQRNPCYTKVSLVL